MVQSFGEDTVTVGKESKVDDSVTARTSDAEETTGRLNSNVVGGVSIGAIDTRNSNIPCFNSVLRDTMALLQSDWTALSAATSTTQCTGQ